MSGARQSPEQLIKQLIQYWATSADGRRRLSFVAYEHFYYKELAPSLVCNPDIGTATEQKILQELRAQLSPNEWEDLPKLIQQLRPEGSTFESENERRRREAQEAQQRDDEERERIRQEQVEKQRAAYLQGLRVLLKTDFLSADRYFEESCSEIITEQEFETEKVSFVKSWLEARASSTHGPQHLPDDEQIAAIAAVRGHIQLIARAGSGKTSTLVHRALFLLTHCRVPATQILILAFNRKAALEVRRRLLALIDPSAASAIGAEIHRRINDARAHRHVERSGIEASAIDAVAASLNVTLPHIMTFHALGYAIVHPEEGLLYNEAEGGAQGLSRAFQQVIDDHLQVPAFQEQIRDLMLAHFREDWEHIVEGRYDQSQEDFLRFRRSLPHESISGEYVKSYGEKVIANRPAVSEQRVGVENRSHEWKRC